jgi:F-type H+-transporting ATPase subunit delta
MARRYAVALADVVTSGNESSEVRQELNAWEEMMRENPTLVEVLRHPTIPYEQKRSLVKTLIERSHPRPTTANFLLVLLQNHRLPDLDEINRQFSRELDRRAGVVTAKVTTARPVDEKSQGDLKAKLAELTKSQVRLQFSVDEELIGGAVTRIGSTVYDGSVRNQLEQARKRMAGEQNR